MRNEKWCTPQLKKFDMSCCSGVVVFQTLDKVQTATQTVFTTTIQVPEIQAGLTGKPGTASYHLNRMNEVRKALITLDAVEAEQTQKVTAFFDGLQNAVACEERRARHALTGEANAIRKRLTAELSAREVTAHQTAAKSIMTNAVSTFSSQTTRAYHDVPDLKSPEILQVGLASMQDLQTVLSMSWSLVSNGMQSSLARDLASCGTEEINAFPSELTASLIAKSQISQLESAIKQLQTSLAACQVKESEARSALIHCIVQRRMTAIKPQCVHAATYQFSDKPRKKTSLALNNDASLFAISNLDECTIAVYSLPDVNLQSFFGLFGCEKGEFAFPTDVCFTPGGGTLLVSENCNNRVQEVTLTGTHVRFIGQKVFNSKILYLACNAEILVVTHERSQQAICVFDMVTGNYLHGFGRLGRGPGELVNIVDVCISPDGSKILVPLRISCRLSVFSVDGNFLFSFGESFTRLRNIVSVEMLLDGRILVAVSGEEGKDNFNPQIGSFSVLEATAGRDITATFFAEGICGAVVDGAVRYPRKMKAVKNDLYVLDSGRLLCFRL